ncbi:hypothetical protein CFC21_096263 [Triticum aestivum]|uniref:F-box domain-containing protein n=2 Tax=Triticum aestivum TaxID=4565 RepID=A0A3B6RDT1_WHEAT|nr:hypothetical protein CFC21_096263 [Triticum aestivum]
MAEMSPLHRVIDAARWDKERLLGRLIILVHAAFLDAGFVFHADSVLKSGRVPRRAGRTASTLSLVFAQDPRPGTHWVCVDARAAAPLLSGGLDDTARALTDDDGDSPVAALWRELTEKLCRSTLVAVCPGNTLLSLPVDVMLDILARLTDGVDLFRVASTCAGLGRLVADHDSELWKHRYKASFWRRWNDKSPMADDASGTTWMKLWCKERREDAKFAASMREYRRQKSKPTQIF